MKRKDKIVTMKQYKRKYTKKQRAKHTLRFAGIPIVIDAI
jgi:hypothetical protein